MSVSGRSGTPSFSESSAPNSTAAAESSPASISGASASTVEPSTSITSSCASSSEIAAGCITPAVGVVSMLDKKAVPSVGAGSAWPFAAPLVRGISTAAAAGSGALRAGAGSGIVSFQTWTTADSGMRNCHFSAGLSPSTSCAYACRISRRRSLPEVVFRIERAVMSTIADGRTPSDSEISLTTPRRFCSRSAGLVDASGRISDMMTSVSSPPSAVMGMAAQQPGRRKPSPPRSAHTSMSCACSVRPLMVSTSLIRPTMYRRRSQMKPRSPERRCGASVGLVVLLMRARNVSVDRSSSCQYPPATDGPHTQISPTVPSGSSSHVSLCTIFTIWLVKLSGRM
mmetsp:Transcript_41115/g.133793  ORF Transcript_41115/g.133793 Transcript_41115/m.133793 type:complete len:341 (+) Transcript_41115:26-1048(+)